MLWRVCCVCSLCVCCCWCVVDCALGSFVGCFVAVCVCVCCVCGSRFRLPYLVCYFSVVLDVTAFVLFGVSVAAICVLLLLHSRLCVAFCLLCVVCSLAVLLGVAMIVLSFCFCCCGLFVWIAVLCLRSLVCGVVVGGAGCCVVLCAFGCCLFVLLHVR